MKLVLWDWNGTIVNDAPIMWSLFNSVLGEIGHPPVDYERYRELYRHPVIEMYRDAGINLEAHPFEELAARWHRLYEGIETRADLHHDVRDTLSHVAEKGHRQAVLSALPEPMLRDAVSAYRLDSYFEHVRGLPNAHGESKVAAGVELVEHLGVSPERVVIVGDSSHDAEVARAVGADCVLVARGLEPARSLARHGFPVVEDLESVREL